MYINIYTPDHTLFDALLLQETLSGMGYKVSIVDKVMPRQNNVLYIIYAASTIRVVPAFYIIYQTEVFGTHHFSPWYFTLLRGALGIWEYSPQNIERYKVLGLECEAVPPSVLPQPKVKKDIPALFYGWINGSSRRSKMLTEISKGADIEVVTNLLGSKMWELLSRAKVVVNIHYYQSSPLELFRVNEALSHNCHVITEPPTVNCYDNLVTYAKTSKQFIDAIKKEQSKPFQNNISTLDNTEQVKSAILKASVKLNAFGINL